MDQTTFTISGILVGLGASAATVWGAYEARSSRLEKQLETPEGRARLLARYDGGGEGWVTKSLKRFNDGTVNWMGPIGG